MSDNCVFSYLITDNKVDISTLPMENEFGKYTIYTDGNTPFYYGCNGEIECAVYGLALNVKSNRSDHIVDEIVETCKSIQDVVEYEAYLGGKYILLFKNEDYYYIQGDATCSIPIYYNKDDDFICSSNCNHLVKLKNYSIDSEFGSIRKSSDISQAMPYDITQYKNIKQLIPNHYLDINKRTAVRFVNTLQTQKKVSVDEATETVAPMVEKLLEFYHSKYRIYCPITSGRDSRVVLSFLMKRKKEFSCYTIKHSEHNKKTQDIVISVKLCEKANVSHSVVSDVDVTDSLKNKFDDILGQNNYSLRTLMIAETINKTFGDGAVINGDIIGQIGKCSLHRDIPLIFATPSYFRCKLHNYSNGAKTQLKQWLEEIRTSGEKINVFDLFSVENRMGRWAGQENLVYNTLGQVYLNIFNCRRIIYTWTAVDRKERKHSKLHIDLIKNNNKILLDVPFEKDENVLIKLSKATGITYLISSYLKYYIDKIKFKKGEKT